MVLLSASLSCGLFVTLSFYSGVVLADGFVAGAISSTFGTTQPVATMVQAHAQGGVGGAPTLVSSPRPSILRKKPANEG